MLVLLEHEDGELRSASRAVLAFARGLSSASGEPLHAVAVGDGTAALGPSLGGVHTLHAITIDGAYAPAAWARAVAEVVDAVAPGFVMAAATDPGNEILAHLGAMKSLPMVANCIGVSVEGPALITREQWGGAIFEEVRSAAPVLLLTLAPSAALPTEAGSTPAGEPIVEERMFVSAPEDLRACLTRVEPAAGSGVNLPEARVVIGGGRGVGSAEGFAIIEALAGELGGAVGVSRAVTSSGWRPHAEQVGQTGVRIAPDLYIACGVSGASQHMVGCASAKRILAINTDADAPIMARADQAVIADLHSIVPAIIDELKRRRGA